jgi:hypothetical protein
VKTSAQVFDAINALELRFPVSRWRSGDIDLWPTFRFRLFGNALSKMLLNTDAGAPAGAGALLRRASRALLRVPCAAVRDWKHNARVQAGSVAVFFSDGVSFVRLGNAWLDRVMDPVILSLEQRGVRTLKLTPLAEAHVPRLIPSRFVQPSIDRIKLTASPRTDLEVPEFDGFLTAARQSFGDAVPALRWLSMQAGRMHALARWFDRTLSRTGPSHAFVNTYYSLEGLAFVQAARRLGIRSVDMQHGIQGQHHIAYARWLSVPEQGYSNLPDEFWVWGSAEASVIQAWQPARAVHVPSVTGNFWLRRWVDGRDPLIARYIHEARALRDSRPGLTQVLVSLSWGVPDEETTKLLEAASACGPKFNWWWRLHPFHASRSHEFARRLERHGLDGSQVAVATELPLYALLRAAQVHVAHSSTVIQEAAALGVPSVVTSDYGAEVHEGLIRSGVALHALDPVAIAAAVQELARRPPVVQPGAIDEVDLECLLDRRFALRPGGAR